MRPDDRGQQRPDELLSPSQMLQNGVGGCKGRAGRAQGWLLTIFRYVGCGHKIESQVDIIGFTMDLACINFGTETLFGRPLGVPLDLAGPTERTFVRAGQQYRNEVCLSQVVRLLEESLAPELRASGFAAVGQ